MAHAKQFAQALLGKRILVSGKGGSGKSTVIALMAAALQRSGYEVIVLDGDASNPEGLIRLLFGMGVAGEPKPLIDFFGGIQVVTCPVDDPAPLTRIHDSKGIPEKRIDLLEEIPAEYYLQKEGIRLLQVGKIQNYGQGCDGPLEKVVRDFLIEGPCVNLIDMKAGIEHFGRRIPDYMDVVLGVLDSTLESVSIAKKMAEFCREANLKNFWLILNKMGSAEVESLLINRLGNLRDRVIGSVPYDEEVLRAGLFEKPVTDCRVLDQVRHIVERLEQVVSKEGMPT